MAKGVWTFACVLLLFSAAQGARIKAPQPFPGGQQELITGQEEQEGDAQSGDGLEFSMPVRVLGIRRFGGSQHAG